MKISLARLHLAFGKSRAPGTANSARIAPIWLVVLTLAALAAPLMAACVLFDQAQQPMLGIYPDDANPPVITEVLSGSGAAAGGLRPGDVVVSVDGLPYVEWRRAPERIGQIYLFMVARQGRRLALPVTAGSMLQANLDNAIGAILVGLIFCAVGLVLLRRRFHRADVRLLSLFLQACAVTLTIALSYPLRWLAPHWLLATASTALIMAAPLLLHYQITAPVALGSARLRSRLLGALYALAALGAFSSWPRPQPWTGPAILAALLVGVGALGVGLYVYFRRASAGARRRFRVALAGTAAGLLPPMIGYVLPTAVMGYSPAVPRWGVSLYLAIIPLSYLYATLRHDLFGIDHLLNRATVYALLSAGVFGLYLVALLLLYRSLPDGWFVNGALATGLTLLAALTFQPIRAGLQRLVDRLFYAGWYDYPAVVSQASARLARSRDWDDLADILTHEVPLHMQLRGARFAAGPRSATTLEPADPPALELLLDCAAQGCATWAVGQRKDGKGLDRLDRRILQTLARQAEITLSNVLLLEALRDQVDELRAGRETLVQLQQQLLRSREEERGRLARDLHDGPIQVLVGMNMQLGMLAAAAGRPPAPAGPWAAVEPIAETLPQVRAEVRDLLGELRQLCTELRPPMLDTLGLGAALRALADEWSTLHCVPVHLDLPPDEALQALPEEVAVNLYRIAQEALSNIARHARARRVDLWLAWRSGEDGLELTVQDDGCGFAPRAIADLAGGGHFGLAGIRERARLIGGRWRLESAPGRGTLLSVTWPGPAGAPPGSSPPDVPPGLVPGYRAPSPSR